MSDLFAVAGSKFFIGGVLPSKSVDFVAGDFASQVWVEVDGWETCGALGDAAEVISTPLINRNRVVKQQGTNDAGEWENNFAVLPNDAGQIAMLAAQASPSNYAFKVEWATGEVSRFIGLVSSKTRAGGNANTIQMRSFNVAVNSNLVET
jgi:hypothetical protein